MRWTLPCERLTRWPLGKGHLNLERGFPGQQDPAFTCELMGIKMGHGWGGGAPGFGAHAIP